MGMEFFRILVLLMQARLSPTYLYHYLMGGVVTSASSAKFTKMALTGKVNWSAEDLLIVGALVCKVDVIDNN